MNKPEVLAPAGSFESLVAAVRAGADAVYLGADGFNARRNARNFTIEKSDDATSLAEAVSFCHTRGVKVHLTLNTLVREREMDEALRIAKAACACGVDALIVQDRGLARRIHAAAPSLVLHASTQLSCHTPEGVRALRDIGFSRVVLAREMTRDEIAACRIEGCELEVFVHGALCMSVSGQCELSALLGGRSGNRGLCAQPCRLPFAVGHAPRAGETALSLKDQSLYDHLEELRELGVASLKIEGRMKRPEYVAAATAVLRRLVDGETPDATLVEDLQAVFSRSGFTDGYFVGKRTGDMFGARRAEDVAAPAVLSRLARLYDREVPRVPVSLHLSDHPLCVTATDADGNVVRAEAPADTPRLDRAVEVERVIAQLSKTGGTPFVATATAECAPAVPLSVINALRREVLERLAALRGQTAPIPFAETEVRLPSLPEGLLSGLVARVASAEQIAGEADAWIVPLGTVPSVAFWGVEIPRGLFGREESVQAALHHAAKQGASFALCNNVGAVPLARAAGLKAVAGPFWNITNRDALYAAAEDGADAAVLSFELTFPQMRFAEEAGGCNGLFAYGRQPLMLLRNCPASAQKGCGDCHGDRVLVDRMGAKFPLQCADGCSEMLNAVPLYLADKLAELPPLSFRYLHFTDETSERVAAVLEEYRHGGTPPSAFTRGLYKRGVE